MSVNLVKNSISELPELVLQQFAHFIKHHLIVRVDNNSIFSSHMDNLPPHSVLISQELVVDNVLSMLLIELSGQLNGIQYRKLNKQ